MPLTVKLSFGAKNQEQENGDRPEDDDDDDDEVELISDNGSERDSIPDLPPGTVVVHPEPVKEKKVQFKGPEFKSASKRGSSTAGGSTSSSTVLENLFCTSCGRQVNPWKTGMVKKHKELKVLICRKCYNFLGSGEIVQDEDGFDEQCRWCGEGGRLSVCDRCPRAFCKACIMRNFGRKAFTEVSESDWNCYSCDPTPLAELRKHCRAVFDAIDAANSKKSAKAPQPESATVSSMRSSSLRSSSKRHTESDDDLGSLVQRMLANTDFSEESIESITENFKEVTTSFQHVLGSIQNALKDENDTDSEETSHQLPFSSNVSVGEKRQHCTKLLKTGLRTFFTSVCKIFDDNNTQSSSSSNSGSSESILNGDVQSDHMKKESASKTLAVNGASVASSSVHKNSSSSGTSDESHKEEKNKEKEIDRAEKRDRDRRDKERRDRDRRDKERRDRERKDKEKRERERKDKEKRERERKDKEKRERERKDKEKKERERRDKERKDRERREKEKRDKQKLHKQQTEVEVKKEGKGHEKQEQTTEKEKKGDDQQKGVKKKHENVRVKQEKVSSRDTEAVDDSDVSSEGEEMEVENYDDQAESGETDKKMKKGKKCSLKKSSESVNSPSKNEVESEELDSGSDQVKKSRGASPEEEEDNQNNWDSAPITCSQEDSDQQGENLLAKLELIQELAEEFCKETEAEKNTSEQVEDAVDDVDSDDEDLPEVTFAVGVMDDQDIRSDGCSDKEQLPQPETDNGSVDDQVNSPQDVSDADSNSGKKSEDSKQASRKKKSTKQKDVKEKVSPGKKDKHRSTESKKSKAGKRKKSEAAEEEDTAVKADDSDNEDVSSSDLILSCGEEDEDEKRAKQRRRLKKKQVKRSVRFKGSDDDDESAEESDKKKKKKQLSKSTLKKQTPKEKIKSEEKDEDDEEDQETQEMKPRLEDSEEDQEAKERKQRLEDSDEDRETQEMKPRLDDIEEEGARKRRTKSKEEGDDSEHKGTKKRKSKSKDEEEDGEENGEGTKRRKIKSKRELNSSEEDEQIEQEVANLMKDGGKKKKKKKEEDEEEGSSNDEAEEESPELGTEKATKKAKEKSAKKPIKEKRKKKEDVSSDSSDADVEDADEDDEEADDSDEEILTKSDKNMKEGVQTSEDIENELAKAAMLDELDEENDEEDKEEDEEDSSTSESDIGAVRKRKTKKSDDQKDDQAKEDEDEDSDFKPAVARKLFSSKLLDAKLSDSDSDIGVSKKKKGVKRKRDSDDESFHDDKSDNDDADDDDGGDSVVDSDEVSSNSNFSDDSTSAKKKGKKKGKGKGKGKEKTKKRKRIKKMDSSSEAEPAEGEDAEDTPSRKKIRKIKSDKKLQDTTKAAAKAEEERRKRVKEKQEKFNGVETTEAGDGQAPITTKLVLEQKEDSEEPLIQVNPKLIRKLKPHQVEAVQFMWDCMFESLERSKKPESSAGCILAHCMGLGKTLSVVAFVHTMMTHRKLTKVKTCLIVSPLNTVLNWQNEFEMWLDEEDQLEVNELSSVKQNNARADVLEDWHNDGGIMIIGYEMLRNLSLGARVRNKKQKAIFYKTLIDPGPDLVVCDEGHLMKNSASALSKAMSQIKTRRRVVLTGTPLQNNLIEYHCMVDFVKPNLLGTKKEFANRFVNPIINGQHADSTGRDVRIMKNRAHVLHELLAGCVQRRDYSALTKFLPPKQEYVISVRLSEMQITLYEEYLKRSGQVEGQITTRGAQLFKDYQNLMKIWTHPWVLKLAEIRDENKVKYDDEDSFIDDSDSDEKSFGSSSSSSESEVSNVASDADSAEEGTSSGRRSRRLRKKDRGDDKEEVVKDWKTKSRGRDGGESDIEEDLGPQAVSEEWWAQYVKEEDQNKMEHSGKLVLLFDILRMCEEIGDKVLIFSQSLLSLDIIEYFLEQVDAKFTEETQDKNDDELQEEFGKRWIKGEDYFRLDGSTSAQMRQHWAGIFNDLENLRARLFLISTRAGGLGINLVGANRVIIFDASWNPSHDVQSIFRVYRFGQTKPCYIYRFMAQGTMEEKIYDRQVTKLSLSQRVVDEHQVERHFTAADLSELYVFKPDHLSDSQQRETLMLPKDVLLAEIMSGEQRDWFVALHEHDSLLENLTEQKLTEEEKKAAWEEYENEKKGLYMNATPGAQMGNVSNYLSQEFLLRTAQALRERNPDMPDEMLQTQLQQIVMMQFRKKQEEQRRLEMMERQQVNQAMMAQQQYAQLQQQYMNQMGQHGNAMFPGVNPRYRHRFPQNLYSRMASPAVSIFRGRGGTAAWNHPGRAGTSQAATPSIVEVIDVDEN